MNLHARSALLTDAIRGLSQPRKRLPSKHFYDEAGSRLFEAICGLPEYHVTRTEMALLGRVAPDIAGAIPPDAALVEFGSGMSLKTRLVLDAAPQLHDYVPIDISAAALKEAVAATRTAYPDIRVFPLVADFTAALDLPGEVRELPHVGFFPGSTIGNFDRADARSFLVRARDLLGTGAQLLLGADLTLSEDLLRRAYDDEAGITAAFNLNLLVRLNRECGADFELEQFRHEARWLADEGRVEMHLVSTRDQVVTIAGHRIGLAREESIHTENSHKYRPEDLRAIAESAGWRLSRVWDGADPVPVPGSGKACFGLFLFVAG